jgi:hypothetical protein
MDIGFNKGINMAEVAAQETQLPAIGFVNLFVGFCLLLGGIEECLFYNIAVTAWLYRAMKCGVVQQVYELFAFDACGIEQLQVGREGDVLRGNRGAQDQLFPLWLTMLDTVAAGSSTAAGAAPPSPPTLAGGNESLLAGLFGPSGSGYCCAMQ